MSKPSVKMSIGNLYLEHIIRQRICHVLKSRRHRVVLAAISLAVTLMLTASAIHNNPVSIFANVPKTDTNVLVFDRAKSFAYLTHKKSLEMTIRNTSILYENYFKLRSKKLTDHSFEFLLNNASLCASESPFLLIVVPSLYHHREIRAAIRATWGSVSQTCTWSDGSQINGIKLMFLFGTIPTIRSYSVLREEQQRFGDIVQANFVDSYRNLTIKMVTALRWVSVYCPKAKYILKADEDVFVNLPRLKKILHENNFSGTIFGRIYYDSKVPRFGKWTVPFQMYPFATYPGYAQGNTYVIPGELAGKMFNCSQYLPYLSIEDAFITGILAKAIDAKLKDIPGFTFFLDTPPSLCDFTGNGDTISKTKLSLQDYYDIWDGISRNSTCSKTDKEVPPTDLF